MAKELFISTTPHETKVAVVEDEQLAEIYFERENEYTLAGSIYKGASRESCPECSLHLSISDSSAMPFFT